MADGRHDLLDSFIDMQSDLSALSNPLDALGRILDDSSQQTPFNPDTYKFTPRANTIPCTRCMTRDAGACSACLGVCPVGAITIEKSAISVSDACRKCGLCVAACPTDAFTDSHHSARQLYDRIVEVAATHEMCYVTCTRALRRHPAENEVLLPCVGAVPAEVWFSVLVDYPNLSVFLPKGVCDTCRTTTGEACYMSYIARAEKLSGRSVGLETNPRKLNHAKKRSYERQQFVNNALRAGQSMLAMHNPLVAGAVSVQQKLQEHGRRIDELQTSLERITGETSSSRRKRTIVQKRQLLLKALQDHPRLADRFSPRTAVCDSTKCTSCDLCVDVCPTHCIDMNDRGRVSVEPIYCMDCSACVRSCPTGALFMEPYDPAALVVKDPVKQREEAALARQRERLHALTQKGKQQLMRSFKVLMNDAGEKGVTAHSVGIALRVLADGADELASSELVRGDASAFGAAAAGVDENTNEVQRRSSASAPSTPNQNTSASTTVPALAPDEPLLVYIADKRINQRTDACVDERTEQSAEKSANGRTQKHADKVSAAPAIIGHARQTRRSSRQGLRVISHIGDAAEDVR